MAERGAFEKYFDDCRKSLGSFLRNSAKYQQKKWRKKGIFFQYCFNIWMGQASQGWGNEELLTINDHKSPLEIAFSLQIRTALDCLNLIYNPLAQGNPGVSSKIIQIASFAEKKEIFEDWCQHDGFSLERVVSPTGRDLWMGLVQKGWDSETTERMCYTLKNLGYRPSLLCDNDGDDIISFITQFANSEKTEIIHFLYQEMGGDGLYRLVAQKERQWNFEEGTSYSKREHWKTNEKLISELIKLDRVCQSVLKERGGEKLLSVRRKI